jgi:exodeoxyribonuclease-5
MKERYFTLNDGQQRALNDIASSVIMRRKHLLTGYAGTGKTFLLQALAEQLLEDGQSFVLTAPTHKAVEVLARKLRMAGIRAACQTVHALLSLVPAKARSDKKEFERKRRPEPVLANVVIMDECSMLSAELMEHIDRHLAGRAVIFSGDPAQLPPVGEIESKSFDIMPASHLGTIVRQAEGNPIIQAAHLIRQSQGTGSMDWSWMNRVSKPPLGVYIPDHDLDAWMRKGFLSDEFEQDPDSFRYLCYTNQRVAEVNAKIRKWRYGNVRELFAVGERALIRSPHKNEEGDIDLTTNQEVMVTDIGQDEHRKVPIWDVLVETDMGLSIRIRVPRDLNMYQHVLNEMKDDIREGKESWQDFHDLRDEFVMAQSIFALTVHNSQGSTFKNVFVDIPDIRKRSRDNVLECQQLLYVAATRPTHALILAGVRP